MEDLLFKTVSRQKYELSQDVNLNLVSRMRLLDLKKHITSPLVKVISGPRRCGKSTLARAAIKGKKFAYLNFEDEGLPKDLNGDAIINTLNQVYGSPDLYFFDEIQNFDRWEQFIHRLHREGKNCLITGSNAHLLSSELATSLTGRHILFELLPFSYSEFLTAGNEECEANFLTYLIHGGFPEVILQRVESKSYLSTLWDSIILKDIARRHKIRNIQELNDLFSLMIHSVGSRFSHDSFTRALSKNISAPTVKKFLKYGRDAFLFTELERFHFGIRKRMKFDRKSYTFDNGFLHAKRINFSDNYGTLLENLVFIELLRRGNKPNSELFYYTTESGYEVDFLLRNSNKNQELIQVSWTIQEQKTKERELRSLVQAASTLKVDQLKIITMNHAERVTLNNVEINILPARHWLLNQT